MRSKTLAYAIGMACATWAAGSILFMPAVAWAQSTRTAPVSAQAESSGTNPVAAQRLTLAEALSLDEVADHRPEQATNRAMDHKRANNAVDALLAAGVLLRTGDPDRFQISPIIEVLLPIEKLRALWTWLLTANGADGVESQDTE